MNEYAGQPVELYVGRCDPAAVLSGAKDDDFIVTRYGATKDFLLALQDPASETRAVPEARGVAGDDLDAFSQRLNEYADDVKRMQNARPEDLDNKIGGGPLPAHMLSDAKAVVSVDLELRLEDRGRELDITEVAERFAAINSYQVSEVPEAVSPEVRKENCPQR